MFGGRIVLAVDVSPWLRRDAPTCPERLFCHVYGRGRDADQRIPGWPYQVVAALESGPTSWTAVLDAVRLGPADDATAVTAAQLRTVVGRLQSAGHWRVGDPPIMVVLDSGYDVTGLAFVLADLPVHLVGRIRADRVLLAATPPRPVDRPGPMGRPRRHGAPMALADPDSWPAPTTQTVTDTARYGRAQATGWDRMHPRLEHRGSWAGHPGPLPIVEGTVIRLQVEHLPGQREAKPVWLWSSHTAADTDVSRSGGRGLSHGPVLQVEAPQIGLPAADDLGGKLLGVVARVSLPAREDHPAGQRAETEPSRPRTPTREAEPLPRHPLRRRQDPHPRHRRHQQPSGHRLNDKLRTCVERVRRLVRVAKGGGPDRAPGGEPSARSWPT
jgi:hypothetical protein